MSIAVWTLVFVLNGKAQKLENLGGEGCILHMLGKPAATAPYCISSDGRRVNRPPDCETIRGFPLYCRPD